MTTTPAGWYDDGQGALRWWDGAQWTEHVHAADVGAPAIQTGAPALDEPARAQPAAVVPTPPADLTAEMPASSAPALAPTSPAELDPATALGFGEPAPAYAAYQAPVPPAPGAAYPGGYPGQPVGGFVPAYDHAAASPPPAKRSLWWIWVVAGAAVLVVLIVLAVVFVPMAIRAITGGGGGGVGGGSAEEQASVAAVQTYDDAWQGVDCDLMFSITTAGFREDFDLTDCAVFEEQATDLAATTSDYVVKVTSVETQDDGTVVVKTTETYDDAEGESYSDLYTYLLVADEGEWLIDDADIE